MADSGKKLRDNEKEMLEYNKSLSAELSKILETKGKIGKLTEDESLDYAIIMDKLKGSKNLGEQITKLTQERNTYISEQVQLGNDISDQLIEQFDTELKLLEKKKELKDLEEQRKEIGKDLAKDLGSAVGVSGELVDAIMKMSVAAVGLVILKEIASFIGDAVKRMKDLAKETGASASQAMALEGSIKGAQMSLNPFVYSFEEVAASAKALREETGQINPPASLLADITEVNALLSDPKAATSLTRTLQNAGIDAGDLANEVKEIGQSLGQDAGPAMEYFADNQALVRTLTKDQLKQRATEVIQLKKMGIDMKKMKDLASESLDIEKSMKDEMKLRMITGKAISFDGIRAAQASGDALAMAREQKALIDSVGPSLGSNLQLQRQISDATGLSVEEMMNMQNATAEAVNSGQELDSGPSDALGTLGTVVTVLAAIAAGGLVVYGILLLMGKLPTPKFLQSKKGSNPIANFIGKFGSTDVLKGAAAMLLVAASMFVMAMAISKMPTDPAPYLGMAVGLGLMLGALYLLAKFPTADLLKGALALAVVGVSLIPFAFAMNLIGDISIGAILAVAAGIVIFTAIILGLGMVMFSGIGAMIFGAGILALLALGAAMIVLGVGIIAFNKGVSGLGDNISLFVEKMGELIGVTPMLLAAVIPLMLFGYALIPFALGLLIAAPPMLMFGLAMIPFVAGITALSAVMPLFVESLAKLTEQAPNLIAVGAAFGVFSGALLATTAAMIPFFPTFLATTLGILALVPAMLVSSVATNLWSLSLTNLSNSIERLMPNLTAFLGVMPMMAAMIMLVPGLIALSASFIILSASLVALSGGLAIVTLLLPTLFALAFALPLISEALGGGGDSDSAGSDSSSMAEVVDEIKGLRQDIQNQPIMINVDGKVVSEITKVQSRKLSTRLAGYFGG
jgi:hypothetical protein